MKPKSLQVFSRQFATMIEAGLSVVTALVILEQQTDDQALQRVIDDIREHVETGSLLSEAMSQHPEIFSRLYIAMVEAGEAAGVLDTVLDRVAIQIEKEQKIKRRVKGAMIYPMVVLTFASLVMTGMLMFLVPIFVKIFDQLGGKLPTLTQYVMHASNGLRGYWYIIFPAVFAIIFGVQEVEEDRARPRRHGIASSCASRCGIGSVVLQGRDGTLVAHALDADRVGRRHHARARDHRADDGQLGRRGRDREPAAARAGRCLDRPAADRQRHLPANGGQMVKIGEETGELEKMLSKVADFYEDEVDASIQALTSIIEPLMMVGVGMMVGVIIISMYLPMFKLLSLVK